MLQRLRTALARLHELIRRRRFADELDEELRFHLEREIEFQISRGLPAHEARRQAMLAFGGVQRFREETNDTRGFVALDAIARDVRFAARRLRRAPAFTAGIVTTLAVGLGAAAGIGALVYGVMLRPLPYARPDRLVRISVLTPGLATATTEHSTGTLLYFRERSRSFTDIGGYYQTDGVAITDGDAPERVSSAIVTPDVFTILGTRPVVGRLFTLADAVADTVPVMISHDVWQRRFGGDSAVVGKRIEVNRGRRTIIGVLPAGFDFPSPAVAVYFPDAIEAKRAGLNDRYITVIAGLRDGVTPEAAEGELTTLAARLPERFPELSADALLHSGLRVTVRPLREAIVAPVRSELLLLSAMVVVVLLIAVANVTTLSLLRTERLRGEIAVSRALGAGSAAIAQRFVIESIGLALLGAVAALPIAAIALTTKLGFRGAEIPRLHEIGLHGREISALFALAMIVGLLIGLATVARVAEFAGASQLRVDARSAGTPLWRRARQGLVMTQIGLALALLLAAVLMGGSLARLARVDLGFARTNAASFEAVLPFTPYPTFQRTAAFHFEVMDRLRAIPGVTAVTSAMQLPMSPRAPSTLERLQADDGVEATATGNVVPPSYFAVLGIPLRAGRAFVPGDLANANPAVIVSASLSRSLFGSGDAVGRTLRLAGSRRYPAYRVVGVVGDVYGARIPDGVVPMIYFPLLADLSAATAQTPRIPFNPSMHYLVRTEAPLPQFLPAFRGIIASIDPQVPIGDVATLDAKVAAATARLRLTMLLLGVAAVATLLLGAVGLYSVVAYAVAARTQEFAVRLAVGATARDLVQLVLRDGVRVVALGTAAGIVVSLVGAGFIRGALYEVSPTDPRAYAATTIVLVLAALVAMYVPARRAGTTDPARALRGD